MLRGFDAEHGQDIEFRVGGLPINIPSHIHGQGYADPGFLIGATVRNLRVTEGVDDPRPGDFAVAGSIRTRVLPLRLPSQPLKLRKRWRTDFSRDCLLTTRTKKVPTVACDGTLERSCENEAEILSRGCSELEQICLPGQGCANQLTIEKTSEAYRSL